MGCCLSTTSPTKSLDEDVSTRKLPDSDVKGGAKPPGLVLEEEETVKEVLSETQTPISMAPSTSVPEIPIQLTPTLRNNKATSKVQLEPSVRFKESIKEEQEEISVVSEMYSISGSFSATTVNDGDDCGEVNQRKIHRSPAKKRSNNSRVNARAKYGGLRSLESSNSREISRGLRSPGPSSQVKSRPRPAQGRTAIVQQRSVGHRDRDWQGLVESSAQRLGSPAAVSEVMRHQRTAVSGVTRHPGDQSRVRKLEERKRIENLDGAVSRESLDNPRVSLECFIFL
ncbi:neurofilament medium polypeptide-like [Heracleum sosnowskyi]|uniref:Neurofilament medium polypeptide-like n=1 Tax=Heracleum sosnowskyi TaxID=360622 RepID=A0AAD8JJE2_9APIA|nr:neurofilament medium polypeptide-like [Heracleum sosnowskyi]